MSLRAPKVGLGAQKSFQLPWEKDVTRSASRLVVQSGNALNEAVTPQEVVPEWWWEGCRRNASTNAAEGSSCYRKERKRVGKRLEVCRTDLHCLKGGNGLPCLSGGLGTSQSSSPGLGPAMSLLLPPLPFAGVQPAVTGGSAEPGSSSVPGLYFQGKDDGENRVPPSIWSRGHPLLVQRKKDK